MFIDWSVYIDQGLLYVVFIIKLENEIIRWNVGGNMLSDLWALQEPNQPACPRNQISIFVLT